MDRLCLCERIFHSSHSSLVKGEKPPTIRRTPALQGRAAAAMLQQTEQQRVRKMKIMSELVLQREGPQQRVWSCCPTKLKFYKKGNKQFHVS